MRLKPGEVGEITAIGENISPGYFDSHNGNSLKFVDNKLMTGDLATIDNDGYIYITGRKSTFIKPYGHRVSIDQIESLLLEIQDVVEVAAMGVPDIVQGEAVKVFMRLRKGSETTKDDIIKHSRKRMPGYMVPKEIVFIEKMPLNPNGKIDREKLKEQPGN